MRLSVVIPTLGGIQLKETIEALQNSSIRPMEILICMPDLSELLADIDLSDNVEIIRIKKKGQVYQRATGFIAAKGDFVLQLDDDFILKNDAIEKLIECSLVLGEKSAVSPAILDKDTKTSIYKSKATFMIWRIMYWIMNGKYGFQSGSISLSGINFGLYFDDKVSNINESEWLPGGCVLHRKENLILEDYFPFEGKAYSEDLLHSFILRERGVDLYICNKSVVYTKTDGIELLQELYKQYKISKYVNSIWGRSLTRLKAYYLIRLIFFFLKKAKV